MSAAGNVLLSAARATILLWGWKRSALAFAAGALSALAMAPFNFWPLLFVTFPVAVWLIDGAGAGRWRGVPAAALAGWWFGFGYFIAGLYWIGYAFLVDADTFAWLLPVAVAGLPAVLALFMAFGFGLARLLWTRDATRLLAFTAALTFSEWLRGHILSGFPWNLFGYALAEPLALAQSAALVGVWGLTFLALAIFSTPAVLVDSRAVTRRPFRVLASALVLLGVMGGYGALRLASQKTTFVDGVKLRLMQPNLQQDVKFNYSAKQAVMDKYLALSDRATGPQSTGIGGTTILIWPESAFPFFLSREADALAQIADFLPPATTLITGSVRPPDVPPGIPVRQAYNSIYAIDHEGSVLSVYDKLHLVPFGEYLPFQGLMERLGFQQLTKVAGGFIAGERRRVMQIPGVPAALPLICYEVTFSGAIVPSGARPGWIVNLTNDGWFGNSTGPYQHLQQARMRAIEEGLPIVRVANTGVSAVIDPLGRSVARMELGREGVLDAALPGAISPPLFARIRDIPLAILMVLSILILVRQRWRSAMK